MIQRTYIQTHSTEIFALGLLVASLGLSNYNVIDFAQSLYQRGLTTYLIGYSAIWLITLIGLMSISLIEPLITRLFWLGLILCSSFIADLNYHMTEHFINASSVELFINSRFSTDSFFDSHWFEIVKSFGRASIVPLLLFCLSLTRTKATMAFTILPTAPLLALYFVFIYSHGYGMRGLPSQYSSIALLLGWATTSETTYVREDVVLPIKKSPAINHVVLIVDESVRADYISLNSRLGVTPLLMTYADGIVNFGVASSGSNCTDTSNAFMRMGADPNTLSSDQDKIFSNPTIWKYASKAGFKTFFIDNQRTSGQLQNYMTENEKSLIDSFEQFDESTPRSMRDLSIIKRIADIGKIKSPTFIYLNKAGAHTHYEASYPAGFDQYQPHLEHLERAFDRLKTVNSYKNLVHYTVDYFFSNLLPKIDLTDTLILYTSDHGQNLLDDGTTITHCRIENPTTNEAQVPLFVVTKNQVLLDKFRNASKLNYNRANHFQIFPTLLLLFGFDQKTVQREYYPSLFDPIQQSPGFTSAKMIRNFGGPAKWHSITWHSFPFPFNR